MKKCKNCHKTLVARQNFFCCKDCFSEYVKNYGAKMFRTSPYKPNKGSFKKGEHRNPSTEFDGSYSKEKHWNWKGGVTKENDTIRSGANYDKWRKAVFQRDNYTCIWCGVKNGNGKSITLHADHIKPFAFFPKLRLEISNGRTLCSECHRYTASYLSRSRIYYSEEKFIPGVSKVEYGGCKIGPEEQDAIFHTIMSQGSRRWTIGPESIEFEKELAEATGVNYAVLCNSGSSALLLATAALKLPKGSKVIIPALNFPTAYSSLLQNNLIPVVVDCDLSSFNLSLEEVKKAIELHPDVKAVVAVHVAGNPVDLPKLRDIVGDRYIISDNCDGFGGTHHGEFIDTFADVSCISMHAAHIISMGEGGAVLTSNEEIATRARKMREWGRASGSDTITKHEGFPPDYRERYVFEEIGWNMKPLELQCAMGRVQLKRLQDFKSKRDVNYYSLLPYFLGEEFSVVENIPNSDPCWFSFPFLCVGLERQYVMAELEKNNIEVRTVFSGNILKHPAYKNEPHIQIGDLENSNTVMRSGMFIGTPPTMTSEMVEFVGKVITEL